MSFFEQMSGKPLPKAEEAEVKLDLRGMEKAAALEKLDAVVTYCKKGWVKSLYIRFDPARPGAGETLFQPIARYFVIEKFHGYVSHVIPMMTQEEGAVYVVFKI
jgi:hypothetical protein